MLQAIRERATGWIAYAILILLVISFALFGITSYFGNPAVPDVAIVGDDAITLQDFQRIYQQARSRSPDANDVLLKQQVMEQLVNRKILENTAASFNLKLSDAQLDATIRSNPEFQVNGVFDINQYQRRLMQFGTTPVAYEQSMKQATSVSQLQRGLIETSLVTKNTVDDVMKLQAQTRDVELLTLSMQQAIDQETLTDDAVQAYFETNGSQFQSAEKMKVQYLALSLDNLADQVNVTDADVEQAYQERLEQYTIAEERKASHILATLGSDASEEQINTAKKKMEALYAELKAGDKTFAEIEEVAANDEQLEFGDLSVITKGMMEPSFEEALFALEKQNDFSEPVKTSFGFHIVRLDEIIPEKVTQLDEVKEKLIRDIQLRRVEPEFFEAAETLANLTFEQQDSLQAASDTLGLPIQDSDWFEKNANPGKDDITRFNEVVRVAYSPDVLEEGYNSQVIEVEPSHLVVIRKLDYQPAAPLTLEQAREQLEVQLKLEQARNNLAAQAAALIEKIKNDGATMEQLADPEKGVTYQRLQDLSRNSVTVDRAALDLAFRMAANKDGAANPQSVVLNNNDQAVVLVTAIDNDIDLAESEKDAMQASLEQQTGVRQYQSFLGSQRAQADVQIFADRF